MEALSESLTRPEFFYDGIGIESESAQRRVEARDVPLCDLVPVFRAALPESDEALNYAVDPHWTPAGHRVAADAVGAWLEQLGWLE